MSEIDAFASSLFEEAKRFLEKAQNEDSSEGKSAYLHAALLLGISSLEAHINAIADELLMRDNLTVLDRSILSERDITAKHGSFELSNSPRLYRTLERIEFVHNNFGSRKIDYDSTWWGQLNNAIKARNDLVHPKGKVDLNEKIVTQALEGVLGALNSLYKTLYRRKYPASRRGLDSSMSFLIIALVIVSLL